MALSEVFKALGDESRLRMLNLLRKRELCVCLVEQTLGMTQSNASKHLNKLRSAGVIRCRKIFQWCFYSVSESFKSRYALLYDFLLQQMEKDERYAKDQMKMDEIIRANDCCQMLLNEGKMPRRTH